MSKVVGIDGGKNNKPKACPFCGEEPACPAWTCPRLKAVSVDEAGWSVEFWPEEGFEIEWEVDDSDG